MNKTIQIQVPEGKVAEWKEINGVTTLVLADEAKNLYAYLTFSTSNTTTNLLGVYCERLTED